MRSYLSGALTILFLSVLAFSCSKEKSLETNQPANPGSGGTAVYSLAVSGGNCMNANVMGTFTEGVATTSANQVEVEVDVTSIGTWNINSATVNGFYFSGSGTFANTGTQTVVLTASGTPTADGSHTFTLVVGTISCSFVVDVEEGATPPPPPNGDYFPMTEGSWWSYDDGSGDTTKITVSGTSTMGNGNTYANFVQTYEDGSDDDTIFYRKDASSGLYYLYQDLSDLSNFGITFTNPFADVNFLRAALNTGDTWNSDHNGTFTGGTPVTVRFKFEVLNSSATVVVSGNTFNNVYRIQMTPQMVVAGTPQDLSTPVELMFAKGVGLIKTDDGMDFNDIRYWMVN